MLKFLLVYAAIILAVPFLMMIPFINNWAQIYLASLGDLRVAFIGFAGSSLGGIVAIFGSMWIQDNIRKKQKESDLRKSAFVIYHDFKLAFDDLLPFYQELIRSEGTIGSYHANIHRKLDSNVNSQLYLDANWINNVATLMDFDDSDLVERIYKTYGDLNDFNKVISKEIKGVNAFNVINRCEKYFDKTYEGEIWSATVNDKILKVLWDYASINP